MKNKKTTITIGIPAYNEEANIANLLKSLVDQKLDSNIIIKNVIVFSDKSTDNTVKEAKSVKSKLIKVIENKKRLGKSLIENKLFDMTTSDIVVVLDADIRIEGSRFINKIAMPIIKGKADLVSTRMLPLSSNNFFSKILHVSHEFKNSIVEEINNGDNVYTCHGAARAFSKDLYKSIKFENSIGEDAYSYFMTKKLGLKYYYQKSAVCYIQIPDNFTGHKKQSTRFLQSRNKWSKEFNSIKNQNDYSISNKLIAKNIAVYLIKHPIKMSLYIIMYISLKLKAYFSKSDTSGVWSTAKTSKVLQTN